MKVQKVINNNQVICLDADQKEFIVTGKGIGFGRKTRDTLPDHLIEKKFALVSTDSKFQELVTKIPVEHIKIASDIISFIKVSLGKKIDESIYVSLTDHINFAIERFKRGENFSNPLLWETKRFYYHEYELGIHAINYIHEHLDIRLPEEEAGFIALHIVNAQSTTRFDETVQMTHLIQDVLNIVKYQFRITFDEASLDYNRFLTHLRFFTQRLLKNKTYKSSDDEFCRVLRIQYPDEYACAEKIKAYILKEYDHLMSEEETMYLAVHINRLRKSDN